MFKRKKTYPEIVAGARDRAEKFGLKTIVYQKGKTYDWCYKTYYSTILETSNEPVIRLLMCLPDGTVVQ